MPRAILRLTKREKQTIEHLKDVTPLYPKFYFLRKSKVITGSTMIRVKRDGKYYLIHYVENFHHDLYEQIDEEGRVKVPTNSELAEVELELLKRMLDQAEIYKAFYLLTEEDLDSNQQSEQELMIKKYPYLGR